MRSLLLLPCAFVLCSAQAQHTGPVAARIAGLHASDESPVTFHPFAIAWHDDALDHLAANTTTAELDRSELQRLHTTRPSFITVAIPHDGSTIMVELYRTEIAAPGARILTDKGEFIAHERSLHYRGTIPGTPGSLAAFSFFHDEVVGVVSSPGLGDLVVGELRGPNPTHRHVIYAEDDLTKAFPMICGVKGEDPATPTQHDGDAAGERSDKCVRIYYELSDNVYAANDSDLTLTTNWITAIHNIVATVYANDGITISLSDVFIWTTPMPFWMTDPANNVNDFANYRTAYNGDVAHCINVSGGAGAANLANLCMRPYAGSNILLEYEELPLYSLTVNIIAHETGHVLGSPHTHDCTWNGNNTQIDDCGNQFPWVSPGPCYDSLNPIIPALGDGTIMSYCPGALAAGFGLQPSQRMLDHIAASGCLGTDCITSCTPSVDSLRAEDVTAISANIRFHCLDTAITQWEIRILGPNLVLITDWTVIDTPSYHATSLLPDGWHRAEVRMQCAVPFNGTFTRFVDFYVPATECGSEVIDNGGVDMPYLYDCTFPPRTYVPYTQNDVVTLTFSVFSVEPDSDFLVIYNGPDVSSPILAELTGEVLPAPITGPTLGGALTVALVCDHLEWNTFAGWVYTVSCGPPLSTSMADMFTDLDPLHHYPDPVVDRLNMGYILSSTGPVDLWLLDLQGRVVDQPMRAEVQQAGAHETSFDLSDLASGSYMLRLGTNDGTFTTRFVKR